MHSNGIEIFGTHYFTEGYGLILIFPFAVWLVICILNSLSGMTEGDPFKWRGIKISGSICFVLFIVCFWDVFLIGQQATRLCREQGGLYIYKTARTNSVAGRSDAEYWSKYGFDFVEYGSLKHKTRYFMQGGEPKYKKIDEFKSQYRVEVKREKVSQKILRIKTRVYKISTNETLGKYIEFSVDGGWADMLFYGLTGFSYSPWILSKKIEGKSFSSSDLVKSTLKPID